MKDKISRFIELIELIRKSKEELKELEKEIGNHYDVGLYKIGESLIMDVSLAKTVNRKIINFKHLKDI